MGKALAKRVQRAIRGGVEDEVQAALASLEKMSTKHDRDNLARFGITASKAFGVSMANIQKLAKRFGRNHELAVALWDAGWYEARMLTAFVDEFVKRAAFALLASLALHDKGAADKAFLESLRLIERAASDDRNFVKKGVNWALRSIGRRSAGLNAAAVTVARRLSESPEPSARWVGKDALRDLTKRRP